jgi:hypothetical protein
MGIISMLLCTSSFALEELQKVELPALASITPRVAGEEVHYLKDGKPYVVTTSSVEDGVYRAEDSSGCQWSAMVGKFGPALSWKDCSGHTGSRKIYKQKGNAFPMKNKSKFSFRYNAKSKNGNTWKGSRKCKHNGGVKIKIHSGEHNTYKLTCVEGKNTRVYYVSSELKRLIAMKRKHKSSAARSYTLELVKVVAES